MVPITLKDALRELKDGKCELVRMGTHSVWQNPDTKQMFSLPMGSRTVSSGVLRKMKKFIAGK